MAVTTWYIQQMVLLCEHGHSKEVVQLGPLSGALWSAPEEAQKLWNPQKIIYKLESQKTYFGVKRYNPEPNEESSVELQSASLQKLEEENLEAAKKLEDVVRQGEATLKEIQAALHDIAQAQLEMQKFEGSASY